MLRPLLRDAVQHVGQALREPEAFAVAWREGRAQYHLCVWFALAGTAILGTMTYGMVMGLQGGASDMLTHGVLLTLAAGLAWGIPLPALYVLNSLSGSRLSVSTTLLAALVTTSWGGLAMIASIPITWFFTVALNALPFIESAHPYILIVNLIVFTGVGVSMVDVFQRVIARLEPQRGTSPAIWLLLVAAIGSELMYFFDLFSFA